MKGLTQFDTPAYAGEPRPLRLVEEATTLADPGWLPSDTGWSGLDELAAEHQRILAARSTLSDERRALLSRFEAEDEAHQRALRQSFRGGSGEVPEVTPPDERRAALASVEDRSRAANDALDEFLAEAVAKIESHANGWLDTLAERRTTATQRREEAARLLAEAEAEELRVRVLDGWLKRNAGRDPRPGFRSTPVRFYPWREMAANYRPQEVRIRDEDAPLATQLEVNDTFPGPAAFAAGLNRGLVPPHAPARPRRRTKTKEPKS